MIYIFFSLFWEIQNHLHCHSHLFSLIWKRSTVIDSNWLREYWLGYIWSVLTFAFYIKKFLISLHLHIVFQSLKNVSLTQPRSLFAISRSNERKSHSPAHKSVIAIQISVMSWVTSIVLLKWYLPCVKCHSIHFWGFLISWYRSLVLHVTSRCVRRVRCMPTKLHFFNAWSMALWFHIWTPFFIPFISKFRLGTKYNKEQVSPIILPILTHVWVTQHLLHCGYTRLQCKPIMSRKWRLSGYRGRSKDVFLLCPWEKEHVRS